MRTVSVATMLVLAIAAVGAAQPPDGERLYNQNCARCHEGNLPALFSSGPIREYPAERIYEALSAGLMAAQATGLSKADKRAVAEYVSGSAPGSMVQPLDQIPGRPIARPVARCRATPTRALAGTAGAPTGAMRDSSPPRRRV